VTVEPGRTPDDRRAALQRGAEAESLVARELQLQGWVVLARNWRGGGGEIDVVVSRDGAVRFVEVKARVPEDPSGFESVTEAKQRKIASAAEAWLLECGWTGEACFLVAVVTLRPGGRWSVELLDDAFDAP
jgi:putative endonuclease